MKRPVISDPLKQKFQGVLSYPWELGLELQVFCKDTAHSLTAEPSLQPCISYAA